MQILLRTKLNGQIIDTDLNVREIILEQESNKLKIKRTDNQVITYTADPIFATINTSITVENGKYYFVDTRLGPITLTIPLTIIQFFSFGIKDYAGTWATNNCTINNNGHKIEGLNESFITTYNNFSYDFVYVDSLQGFKVI